MPKAFTPRAESFRRYIWEVQCAQGLCSSHIPTPGSVVTQQMKIKAPNREEWLRESAIGKGPVTSQAQDCDRRWSFTKTPSRMFHLKAFILYNIHMIYSCIPHTNMHTNILFKIINKTIKYIQIYHYIIYRYVI